MRTAIVEGRRGRHRGVRLVSDAHPDGPLRSFYCMMCVTALRLESLLRTMGLRGCATKEQFASRVAALWARRRRASEGGGNEIVILMPLRIRQEIQERKFSHYAGEITVTQVFSYRA